MKKILVIGENSYIGKSFESFAKGRYEIKMVNSRNVAWKSAGFTGYDSVLHCAGIVHLSNSPKYPESPDAPDAPNALKTEALYTLYNEINCDLAFDVANKAKEQNVKQFIFLSSMAVYGSAISKIDENILPDVHNNNFYGYSKLQAEKKLQELYNDNNDKSQDKYRLCIVRPPMVYGKNCKGNFPRLVKLAKKTMIFPDYPNKRSMIYIDNLCNFLCTLIDGESSGIFLPQNKEYVNTTELVKCIAECYNRRIFTTKLFNSLIRLLIKHKHSSVLGKLFGDLYYTAHEQNNQNSENKQSGGETYNIVGFADSIKQTISEISKISEISEEE